MRSVSRDVPIFGEPLLPGPFPSKRLFELQSRPDLIVRKYRITSKRFTPREGVDINAVVEHYTRLADAILDLKNYGVSLPASRLDHGDDEEGEVCIFIVTQRIQGTDLSSVDSLPLESQDRLDSFLAGILQAIVTAFEERRPYFFMFVSSRLFGVVR